MPNLELTADTIARLVEGVRNLMLLLALPVAIFRGGTAGFQIMNTAGEMQDQVKARKALEHVFWGFLVVVLIAGPQDAQKPYLELLAQISKRLKIHEVRQQIVSGATADQVVSLLTAR